MISQCEDPVEPSIELINKTITFDSLKKAFEELPSSGNYDLRNIAIYQIGDQNSDYCCERNGDVIALLHVGYHADLEDLDFDMLLSKLANEEVLALYPLGVDSHGWWLSYVGNQLSKRRGSM